MAICDVFLLYMEQPLSMNLASTMEDTDCSSETSYKKSMRAIKL